MLLNMSEYEDHKKDMQELIETRKMKMSSPDGGAGMIKEEYVPIVPKTFKEKWINYWYHYKTATFGTLFGAILVFSFVWQIATKTVYDANVVIVSALPFDTVTEDFTQKLTPLATDFTENGKVEISVNAIQQDTTGELNLSPEMVQANYVKLAAGISSVETYIYMLDKENYDNLKKQEMQFMDLTELVDGQKLDNKEIYPLKGTKLAELFDVGEATDDMYLCFVDYESFTEKRQQKKDIKRNYERDFPFFKAMLEYK